MHPSLEPQSSFHALTVRQVLEELRSGTGGLDPGEAQARLAAYGPNRLEEKRRHSPLLLLARQFTDLLILVLAVAAIISGFLGEWLDASAIIAIIVLNGIIGFLQEYRAERSLEALKRMTAPRARVVRGGMDMEIDARCLVPGDLLVISEGDRVPADARLLETVALAADEAALTGESVPAHKDATVLCSRDAGLHERANILFLGTVITRGRGRAVVTGTGMRTELGQIARAVAEEQVEATPLQRKLAVLGKQLTAAALVIVALIFLTGTARGLPVLAMFFIAVSLAVAAIPEGLPAVVTITLSLGVQRMARRHAIIRRLSAVETLGAATVICTDKTGTLTRNEMTVRRLHAGGTFVRATGEGYAFRGEFIGEATGQYMAPLQHPDLRALLEIGVLCNNSSLALDPGGGNPAIIGDPTEASLLVLAEKAGLDHHRLREAHPFRQEIPFDPVRKLMTVVRINGDLPRAYVKGAPEVLVARCTRVLHNGEIRPLPEGEKEAILSANQQMASASLRVLGFAFRDLVGGEGDGGEIERDLVFAGLAGMMDPPRAEAKAAVQACHNAGVRVVMVTGDNPDTAGAVARELDLAGGKAPEIMTGAELDLCTEEEVKDRAERVDVYARVSPGHKLRIVDALRARGGVVAMTGDGVNDAPAITRADIGVAMGITGTDVTKEASDMIITDDNFASIQRAVEEGRVIYGNILRAVKYLLACNTGELVTIFVAIMAGLASPLTPLQILWMNLVTDSPPALALATNPGDPDVMRRPPLDPKGRIISGRLALEMVLVGLLMALVTLAAFAWYRAHPSGAPLAGTVAFSVIILFQKFYALSVSGPDNGPVGLRDLFRNRWLWAAILFGIASQVLITTWAPALPIFDTVPLGATDWAVVFLLSSLAFFVPEAVKRVRNRTGAGVG